MAERTQTQYGLTAATEATSDPAEAGWGSQGCDATDSTEGEPTNTDPTQSAFIGTETTEASSTSTTAGDAETEPTETSEEALALVSSTADDEAESEIRDSEQTENSSSPVQSSEVAVPDEELRKRGLSHDDVCFLSRVLDVMNREAPDYSLLESMRSLRDEYDNLHLQRLKEQDLIEEAPAAGQKYYTVLPAGRELLGQNLRVGPDQGDLGEKTPHKVGVRLLEQWLEQQDKVVRVEPYYEYDDETVFDVAAFDDAGELVWVGEVELPSNNSHAPVDDYDKLGEVAADAIWAFNNRQTAIEVLDRLAEAGRIKESVSGRSARSFSTIRDAVDELDAAGLSTVRGFTNLKEEVNA